MNRHKDNRGLSPWLLAAGLALCWIVATKWLFPSNEEKILSLLDRLAARGSVAPSESPVASALVANEIAAWFTEETRVTLHGEDASDAIVLGRREIARRIAAARTRFGPFSLAYLDPIIAIDGDRARVELTGRALMRGRDGGRVLEEARLRIELRKDGGEWLVAGAENIEPLFRGSMELSQRTAISPST